MTPEEARKLQEEVQGERRKEEILRQYEGLRSQMALLYLDEAISSITTHGYEDDGATPYILRDAYGKVVKELQGIRARLLKVDELDRQRQIPCYTIENGKLVKMKIDDLLRKLQEQNGELGL